MALCLCSLHEKITGQKLEDFFSTASYWARIGSGSASRSVYGGYNLWGSTPFLEGSSDEVAVNIDHLVHHNFKDFSDTILIIEKGKKAVSSTTGHALLKQHPFAGTRYHLAAENTGKLLNILKSGDLDGFIHLVEAEALMLHALMMTSPLWENRILGHQRSKPVMRGFVIDKKATIESTRTIMEEFDVRAPGPDTLAAALSGGNQQKFIVGREMSKAPALLVASHPTRGVDVGAQGAIWDVLRKAREKGMAIVLISADLEELIGMSDRLLVMLRGKLTAELDPAKTTPEQLGSAMTGAE